jgi:hypothetical protein
MRWHIYMDRFLFLISQSPECGVNLLPTAEDCVANMQESKARILQDMKPCRIEEDSESLLILRIF